MKFNKKLMMEDNADPIVIKQEPEIEVNISDIKSENIFIISCDNYFESNNLRGDNTDGKSEKDPLKQEDVCNGGDYIKFKDYSGFYSEYKAINSVTETGNYEINDEKYSLQDNFCRLQENYGKASEGTPEIFHVNIKEEIHDCNICESSHLLKKHFIKKQYKCSLCSYTCNCPNNLLKHMKDHAKKTKSYKCILCNYTCATRSTLSRHMTVHSGERSYRCDICDSSYTRSSSLATHLRKHRNKKTYKCAICDYAAANYSIMIKHNMAVHPAEKMYKIIVCDTIKF